MYFAGLVVRIEVDWKNKTSLDPFGLAQSLISADSVPSPTAPQPLACSKEAHFAINDIWFTWAELFDISE